MPDFTARPVSGVSIAEWKDPILGRLAPKLWPHRYWLVEGAVSAGYPRVDIALTPDGGTEGPADSELDGRLFSAWIIECPGGSTPHLGPTEAGLSSVQRLEWGIIMPGHYTIGIAREAGGMLIMHFDREP